MSEDVVQFVRARLDEDEQAARAATPGPWAIDSEIHAETVHSAGGIDVVAGSRWGGEASVFESTEDAAHIVRWDPARVLADVDAKRRILAWHSRTDDVFMCGTDGGFVTFCRCGGEPPCDTVRLLSSPYRDHPDYQPEWAPVA